MLIRLLSTQISQYWNLISHAVEVAAPPTVQMSPNRLTNILQALIQGKMQCWVALEKSDDSEGRIWGIAITTATEDQCSGISNLLIYAIYSYGDAVIPKAMWLEGLETLKDFAKSLNCQRIVAYTINKRIVEVVTQVLGGKADSILLTLDVEENENIHENNN